MSSLEEQNHCLTKLINGKRINNALWNQNKSEGFDEFFKPDLLAFERAFSKLQLAVNSAESSLDRLRFEDEELRKECERIRGELQQRISEQNKDLLKKETEMKERQTRLNKLKVKLNLLEEITKTKFIRNQDSVTAFIFNPDDLVQQEVSFPLTNASVPESDVIAQRNENAPLCELDKNQIDELWSKLEVSEKWKHLSIILPKGEVDTKHDGREPLTSIDNVAKSTHLTR